MRTSELLKDCKIKLKISSDYALGKELKINSGRISDYMSGKRKPTTYALVKIAECLKLNPLALIAEFEEETAKNKEERNFWTDFRQRAERPLRAFILACLCTLTLLTGHGQANNAASVFRHRKYA